MTDLRDMERASIARFVASCSYALGGHVLDLGCGQQPYRHIIEDAGGVYQGYDRADYPGTVVLTNVGDEPTPFTYDAVVCTQVVQYIPDPLIFLRGVRDLLNVNGHLILTWPTNWPEVEPEDLHRFTAMGMRRLLGLAGFIILRLEPRAHFVRGGDTFTLGYGAVART